MNSNWRVCSLFRARAGPRATTCALALLGACHASASGYAPASTPPPAHEAVSVIDVDHESTEHKLERLVAAPGERSELSWLLTLRAYQSLVALGRAGFETFVACVADPRPVWPEFSQQYSRRTTLGDTCLSLITRHVDALYLHEGSLDFVTAENARAWWQARRDVPLPDLQIEALESFRVREAARAAESPPEVRTYLESEVLVDLERRIARARHERAEGRPLTIER
jgi:hypothetical protein